jgi:flagellar biosynthesis protein FliQ
MLLLGIGCSIFAVWAYIEIKTRTFLPYFIGLLAVFSLVTGLLRLSRAQQYPQLDDEKK